MYCHSVIAYADSAIAHANCQILYYFFMRLLEAFEGTYEGLLEHDLGCKVARDVILTLLPCLKSITRKVMHT